MALVDLLLSVHPLSWLMFVGGVLLMLGARKTRREVDELRRRRDADCLYERARRTPAAHVIAKSHM